MKTSSCQLCAEKDKIIEQQKRIIDTLLYPPFAIDENKKVSIIQSKAELLKEE